MSGVEKHCVGLVLILPMPWNRAAFDRADAFQRMVFVAALVDFGVGAELRRDVELTP